MAAKFELKKSSNGQFIFNLLAGNGQVVLSSETYESRSGALGGIESVRNNAPVDARYERVVAKDGSPYFTLKAVNGQVIGTSEMYSSAAARDKGIESVKTNAPGAGVEDKTA